MIKAIETRYKGYRFRSRLEARWAVFFDALGIKWEYEKEGYDLGNRGYYLPDFWLPQVDMWAEVKGQKFTSDEHWKCIELAGLTRYPVLMLDGTPEVRFYSAIEPIDLSGGGVGVLHVDYAVCDYRKYHINEGRFYSEPSCNDPYEECVVTDLWEQAVVAARSARFEHGEKGAIRL